MVGHLIERVALVVPAMSDAHIEKARALESSALDQPQVNITTEHVLHAGMYLRTITIPAGVLITGALIKIPTVLISSGEIVMYIGGDKVALNGYNVISAQGNRKQAFFAVTESSLTMAFPTCAKTVDEAEGEFTDDFDMLISRRDGNLNNIEVTT